MKTWVYLSMAFVLGLMGFTGAKVILEGKALGQNQLVKGGGPGPSFGGPRGIGKSKGA